MSHSATEQEGKATPAGRKGDSASHRMRKGRRVGLRRQNQEGEGVSKRERLMGARRLQQLMAIWVGAEWLGLEESETEK